MEYRGRPYARNFLACDINQHRVSELANHQSSRRKVIAPGSMKHKSACGNFRFGVVDGSEIHRSILPNCRVRTAACLTPMMCLQARLRRVA